MTANRLNGNLYANLFPLVMLLLTVGYGAACLAGQDEEGQLGLLVALPAGRASIVLQESAVMVLQAGIVALAVAASVLAGRVFGLDVTVATAISASVAALLLGLDLGLVTMLAGAITGRRGAAIATGTSLAAASYLLGSLAPVVSWLRPWRYASLFFWAVDNGQVSHGVSPRDYAVLGLVAIGAAYATVVAFRRLDVH